MGRNSTDISHTVSINDLVEDHAMLAYHSAKSRDSELNMKIVRKYDPEAGEVNVGSEDIGRAARNQISGNSSKQPPTGTQNNKPTTASNRHRARRMHIDGHRRARADEDRNSYPCRRSAE